MMYYKAIITEVNTRNNQKCGEFISLKFNYKDENDNDCIAYKNFFVKHPNQELSLKANQMLYRMRSYITQYPQKTQNIILKNKECFITIKTADRYKNVNQVYFIAQEKTK